MKEPSSSGVIKSDGLQMSMLLLLPGSPARRSRSAVPKTRLHIGPNKEDTPDVISGETGDI